MQFDPNVVMDADSSSSFDSDAQFESYYDDDSVESERRKEETPNISQFDQLPLNKERFSEKVADRRLKFPYFNAQKKIQTTNNKALKFKNSNSMTNQDCFLTPKDRSLQYSSNND